MTKRLTRSLEIQDVSEDGRNFTAMAVRYGVKDSFSTIFDRGCFNDSLGQRLPTITFGHSWADIVGRAKSWEDTDEGLIIHARLSDPEAVPRARQLMAQLRDGDIDDVSVGFSVDDEGQKRDEEGVTHFVRATLDELAIVLKGAVPGARVLAVRSSPTAVIRAETAGQICARLETGQITLREALQELEDGIEEAPDNLNDASDQITPAAEVDAQEAEKVEEAVSDETEVDVEPPTDDEVAAAPELADDDLTDEPLPDDAERAGSVPDASDVPGSNAAKLKKYWTKGPGLAKWKNSPKPWTTLVGLLSKYIKSPEVAKATAAKWFYEVFGETPAQHANKKAASQAETRSVFADLDELDAILANANRR